jgi:hypothetical protein
LPKLISPPFFEPKILADIKSTLFSQKKSSIAYIWELLNTRTIAEVSFGRPKKQTLNRSDPQDHN